MSPEPSKPADQPRLASTSLAALTSTFSKLVDPIAFGRTAAVLTAAGLVLAVSWRVSLPDDEPAAAVEAAAEPFADSIPLSSWPAGPLTGAKPRAVSAQPIQPDGCVDAAPEEDVVLQLIDAVSLWVFADPVDTVTAGWQDDQGTISFIVPSSQFEHQFASGRVTLSAIAPVSPTTLVIRSTPGPVRVCGIETKVG